MADTSKLAGTFVAWRIVFTIATKYLDAAWEHCCELGIQPTIRRYVPSGVDEIGGLISISVTIPSCACKNPEEFMNKEIKPKFKGSLDNSTEVCLICPLPAAV